jgi:hypothetical protein
MKNNEEKKTRKPNEPSNMETHTDRDGDGLMVQCKNTCSRYASFSTTRHRHQLASPISCTWLIGY